MRRRLVGKSIVDFQLATAAPDGRARIQYTVYTRMWRGPGVVRWGEGGGEGWRKGYGKNTTTGVTKNLRSIGFQSSFIIIGGFFLPISFFPLYVDNNTVYILIGRTIVL